MKAIITVLGQDRIGIISSISSVLVKHNINILDINQTIMQDIFTMVTLVDLEKTTIPFDELKDTLTNIGEELGLSIIIQNQKIFDAMHRM